jgi:hypothetical protein
MPTTRLYHKDFKYTPAADTNIVATWRRFGFRPTTGTQRRARQPGNDVPRAAAVAVDVPRRPALKLASAKK